MFIGKIKRTIKKHCMLESGEKIVVGVSGGPDSMALLFVLHQMQENYNLQLQVAHLNHGFRGKEAARDARFVQDMAQGFGLPCEIKFFDVPSFKKRGTLSSQEAARVVRYQFLEGVMKSCNASKIALGHTADDQAETLMMWLLRGTGLKGLGGMPPVRGGIIIRPLIETTREEIETFLKEKRIPFVVDSSNQNADYLRNKLRHQLFPLLKEHYNPQLVKSLVQTASILRIDNEYLEYKTKAILDSIIISHDSTSAVIDSTGLLALPGAIQLRCLRSVLEKVKGNLKRISSTHLNDILKIVLNDKPYKVLQLPEGISVEKSYQQLKLTRHQNTPLPFHYCITALPDCVRIEEIGREMNFEIMEGNDYAGIANNACVACLDEGKVVMPLTIRNVKPGDRFQPLGMQCEKKIKDFFIDEKVPLTERKRIPLVLCNEVVVWVGGMRIDHRLRVTKNTQKILTIAMKSEDRSQTTEEENA
jgi:tRNA(Ile)-lysidine synthase